MSRNETPDEVRRELRRLMETEGARIAYETAKAICQDPMASATAKASAVNSLLRVGGYDGKPDPSEGRDEADWTQEEIQAQIRRVRARMDAEDRPDDLFG